MTFTEEQINILKEKMHSYLDKLFEENKETLVATDIRDWYGISVQISFKSGYEDKRSFISIANLYHQCMKEIDPEVKKLAVELGWYKGEKNV